MRTLTAAVPRSLWLLGLALLTAVAAVATLLPLIPGIGLGMVFLVPWPVETSRRYTNAVRRVIGRTTGVPVPPPYRPAPPPPVRRPDGRYEKDGDLHKRPWWPALSAKLDWILSDGATGKDLLWLVLHPIVGTILAGLPLALIVAAVIGAVTGRWYALAGLPLAVAVAPATTAAYLSWCRLLLRPAPRTACTEARRRWVGTHLAALGQLIALGASAVAAFAAGLVMVLALGLAYLVGIVFNIQPAVALVRRVAHLRRYLSGRWCDRPIAEPYRSPEPLRQEADGRYLVGTRLYKTVRWASWSQRQTLVLREAATWRDLAWALLDPIVGGLIALAAPAAAVFLLAKYGFGRVIVTAIDHRHPWPLTVSILTLIGTLLVVAAVITAAPALRDLHARWTALLLRPTEAAALAARVARLTETRADVIVDQATEVRRIERDLHDGAQARLIALGLALATVEQLMDSDPETAKALVGQARDTSETALVELRRLVRGLHPPVLAERGIGDAVRALALDCPVPVEVSVRLPGRPPATIETAAYFAISESLANAVKHSGATRVDVTVGIEDGRLRLTVRDDGRGGADPSRGTGLTGLARRLGAFDGTVAVSSPAGGPTVVTMEIPCALSSLKTSSC